MIDRGLSDGLRAGVLPIDFDQTEMRDHRVERLERPLMPAGIGGIHAQDRIDAFVAKPIVPA